MGGVVRHIRLTWFGDLIRHLENLGPTFRDVAHIPTRQDTVITFGTHLVLNHLENGMLMTIF
jgi:hypothetical protein